VREVPDDAGTDTPRKDVARDDSHKPSSDSATGTSTPPLPALPASQPSTGASAALATGAPAPLATEDDDLASLGDHEAMFELLWSRTLEAWDEDGPHRILLEHALKHEKLPELAGRYRALKDDPVRSARAQKKIDGIVTAATQLMLATKTPTRTKTPWPWTASAVLMFVIVSAWLVYQLFLPHRP
jgi:hypothetical protein